MLESSTSTDVLPEWGLVIWVFWFFVLVLEGLLTGLLVFPDDADAQLVQEQLSVTWSGRVYSMSA